MTLLRNAIRRSQGRTRRRQPQSASTGAVTQTPQRVRQQPQPQPTLQRVSNSEQQTPETPHDSGLVDLLVSYDSMPENDRLDSQAQSSMIHVSSLPELCPRAVALAAQHGNLTTLLKRVSANDRIVWDMGRATESLVRDRIIESIGVDRVIGRWLCPCGNDEMYYDEEDEYELPAGHHYVPCGCGRKSISVYQELPLYDHDYNIVGNCDLPYFDEQGRVVVTEIKSAKGEYFVDLNTTDPWNQPNAMLRKMFFSHSYQAAAYNRLLAKQGYDVAPYVRILYVSKNYIRQTPYKEIVVPMDRMQDRLDYEWEKARVIKDCLDTGTLPDKLEACSEVDTTRAKNCPLITACFSRS